MTPPSWRRAIFALVAVLGLVVVARASPPELFSVDEPLLGSAEHDRDSAVLRAGAYAEHQASVERGAGKAAAPRAAAIIPAPSNSGAPRRPVQDYVTGLATASHQARAPPAG